MHAEMHVYENFLRDLKCFFVTFGTHVVLIGADIDKLIKHNGLSKFRYYSFRGKFFTAELVRTKLSKSSLLVYISKKTL